MFCAMLFAATTTSDGSGDDIRDERGDDISRALQPFTELCANFPAELGESWARFLFPRQAAHACNVERTEIDPERALTAAMVKDASVVVLSTSLPYIVSMALGGAESVGIRARAAWQHGRRAHGANDADSEARALASAEESAATRRWDMFRALLFVALQRVAVGAIIGHLLSLCGTPGALLSTIWLRFAECAAFAATCGIGMRRTLSLLVRASAGHPCVASSKVDGPGLLAFCLCLQVDACSPCRDTRVGVADTPLARRAGDDAPCIGLRGNSRTCRHPTDR